VAFKRIPLTQGKFALVDEEDYEWLNQWKWYYNNGYAARDQWDPITKKQIKIRMHRIIMNAKEGEEVDHINHNGIDNQKYNLRVCTVSQNMQNSKSNKNSSSQYKGVSYNPMTQKCQVQIMYNGKFIYLGYYKDEEEAARAYDKAAIELFGEFACLNFPLEKEACGN